MLILSKILADLQAAIAARAARAARDRALTVLLVGLWGRIARAGTRLERLIAQWRAGTLATPRAPRLRPARVRAPGAAPGMNFPTSPGWLLRKLGYAVVPFGSQLQHLLTDAEWVAFLAAVPQAGRILRPLLRMLTVDPLPAVVRRVAPVMPVAAPVAAPVGITVSPSSYFLDA